MTTLLNLLDDLRLRLNDTGDSQVTKTDKIRMLNHGLRAMYPATYRPALDTTIVLATDTYEYAFSASLEGSRLIDLELQEPTTNRWVRLEEAGYGFRIVRSGAAAAPKLELDTAPASTHVGRTVRAIVAMPYAALSADADVVGCADELIELPVLYAMGIATSIPLDDRLDYKRYSTTAGQNAVFPRDIMEVSQFWFAQFQTLLDEHRMPVPGAGF